MKDLVDYSKIDLHIHTINSDGTDNYLELVKKLLRKKVQIFSTTEHDTLNNIKDIIKIAKESNIKYINGIEITSCDNNGRYHILGYGFDENDIEFNNFIDSLIILRKNKTIKRLEYLENKKGIFFPEDEKLKLLSRDNPCKPHIVELLLKYNYIKNIKEGINLVNELEFKNEYIDPAQAISQIKKSGGISILAHPIFEDGEGYIRGRKLEERIKYLYNLGLDGIEGYYSRYTSVEQEEVLKIANKFGMLVSIGSDYHGLNKNIDLLQTNISDNKVINNGVYKLINLLLEKENY